MPRRRSSLGLATAFSVAGVSAPAFAAFSNYTESVQIFSAQARWAF
jgi:hypothetical protein